MTNQQAMTLGQIITNSAGADPIVISNVSLSNPGTNFYLAHATNTILTIYADGLALAPTNSSGAQAQSANFVIQRAFFPYTSALTVNYTASGTASNGVDYTTISDSVLIPAFQSEAEVRVDPLFNTNYPDFSKTVTLTLLQSDNFLIDTNLGPSATMWIGGNTTGNEWAQLVMETTNGIGAAYDEVNNRVILSVNYSDGEPYNFLSLNSNGITSIWSGVSGLQDEIKLACVPTNYPNTNFTPGDLYCGTGVAGRIGWLSADASTYNVNWLNLPGEGSPLRGSLCFDTNGVFGYDLIVVTGGSSGSDGGGGVWRVHSQSNYTLLTNLNCHLEGVTTIPNDPKYGPWAGKLLAGAEDGPTRDDSRPPCIFAIDTNGVTIPYFLGIAPEDIHVVPTNQDFYINEEYWLLKLPRELLVNHVGDVMITQSGDSDANPTPLIALVHWNTNSMQFEKTIINTPTYEFEHGTFSPLAIPATLIPVSWPGF